MEVKALKPEQLEALEAIPGFNEITDASNGNYDAYDDTRCPAVFLTLPKSFRVVHSLAIQYPKAAHAHRALMWIASDDPEKAECGKTALSQILSGEDSQKVIERTACYIQSIDEERYI